MPQSLRLMMFGIVVFLTSSLTYAEPPSVADVLQAYRANLEKLSTLHLRLQYRQEPTEAFRESHKLQAKRIEQFIQRFETGEELPPFIPESMTRAQYIERLKGRIKNTLRAGEAPGTVRFAEFFVDGDNYQVRLPLQWFNRENQQTDWNFSEVPAQGINLSKHYGDVRIYSRVSAQSPPAQIWPGQTNPDRPAEVSLTSSHVWEYYEFDEYPPMLDSIKPPFYQQNLIDRFYSAEPKAYRVAGIEEREGRMLTIVDLSVPSESKTAVINKDATITEQSFLNHFRGWIDLERGAIPVELKLWGGRVDVPRKDIVRGNPTYVLRTNRIDRLDNGAFYPAVTVREDYDGDPKAVRPSTPKEWEEVANGEKLLPTVVHERITWECSLIQTKLPEVDDFFILKVAEK